MTEVVYDPREDILVITLGTEKIIMMDNQGQVRGGGGQDLEYLSLQELHSIQMKAREIALGDEGYFAFHFQVTGGKKSSFLFSRTTSTRLAT